MEYGLLQYVGSIGGIGAILAVLMFSLMRHLIKQASDDRKFVEDRMAKLLEDYNVVCKDNQKVQIEHSRVLSELYTYLKMRNGKE